MKSVTKSDTVVLPQKIYCAPKTPDSNFQDTPFPSLLGGAFVLGDLKGCGLCGCAKRVL